MGDLFRHEVRHLSSGAQLFHLQRDVPWTIAGFVIVAGHMHDPVGKEGTAHLLEHHLSGGRIGDMPARSSRELQEWIEDQYLTANLGSTSAYYSKYGGRALNENASTLFRFLSDLVFRPGFDNDIEHDRAIVRAEREDRASPRRTQVASVMKPVMFGNHRRATMTGLPEDPVLDLIRQEDLAAFHRRHYGAPNLRVVTLGGLSADQVALHLEYTLPRRPYAEFQAVGPIPPLPLEPFSVRERTLGTLYGGRPSKAVLRWHWKLPEASYRVHSMTQRCLEPVLMDRVRERLRAAYDVSVTAVSWLDHAQFEIETAVAYDLAPRVRAEVERALRDSDAVSRSVPRVRRLTEMHTHFADVTFEDVLETALMSVVSKGRIELHAQTLSEIANVTEGQIASFLAEDLMPEKSFLTIIES